MVGVGAAQAAVQGMRRGWGGEGMIPGMGYMQGMGGVPGMGVGIAGVVATHAAVHGTGMGWGGGGVPGMVCMGRYLGGGGRGSEFFNGPLKP